MRSFAIVSVFVFKKLFENGNRKIICFFFIVRNITKPTFDCQNFSNQTKWF